MDLSEIPNGTWARHPWEVSRFRFFSRVLGDLSKANRVLDAGAGDGWFSGQLQGRLPQDAEIVCWDSQYTPTQLAQLDRDEPKRRFTKELPSGPFDLLLLLDVMEHVEDDVGFLQSLVDRLNPGANALISVPAWPALYTSHDEVLRHFRRYHPAQAQKVLQQAHLEVCSSGGAFHSLLAPRGVSWALERLGVVGRSPAPDLGWRHGSVLTRAVQGALALDNRLSQAFVRRGLDIPGLSWWALCRRPS